MKRCSMKRKSITSQALEICWATRGQGRTHGDQRTWWRGLRIADRRKSSTFRLLVQVAGLLGGYLWSGYGRNDLAQTHFRRSREGDGFHDHDKAALASRAARSI